MIKNTLFGPLTLLAGVLIFSTNGFWQAIAPEGNTPYVIGASRLVIGGMTLSFWCLIRYGKIRLHGWDWIAIGIYAVALWLYQIFFFHKELFYIIVPHQQFQLLGKVHSVCANHLSM